MFNKYAAKWPFPAKPAPPRPQGLGLFLLPRARPTLASPRQGSAPVPAIGQVGPALSRASPPGRSSPWSPARGDGRGPRRPPPRQLLFPRRECAPPATPVPDLPARDCGSPGQRPRAGEGTPRRPETLPGSLRIPGGTGRGQTPGGCRGPARPVARVVGTWLAPQHQAVAAVAAILPSTRCRRRRTPPQVSRMWAFPGVACAGAQGPGAFARSAACGERRQRPPARRPSTAHPCVASDAPALRCPGDSPRTLESHSHTETLPSCWIN
ncbi:uncharacterized protein AAES06_013450 [Glossophaga mutica]